jgi:hypothetical protein
MPSGRDLNAPAPRTERTPACEQDALIGGDIDELSPVLDALSLASRGERAARDLPSTDSKVKLMMGRSGLAGNAEPAPPQRLMPAACWNVGRRGRLRPGFRTESRLGVVSNPAWGRFGEQR